MNINQVIDELKAYMADNSIDGVVDPALLECEEIVQVVVYSYPHMDAIQQWALAQGYQSCILVAVDAN